MALPHPAVLHWEQLSNSYRPNGVDNFNGQNVYGDIWLETDAQGNPVKFEASYTLRDRTPVQQIYEGATSMTVRVNQPERGLPPGMGGGGCSISTTEATASQMSELVLLMVDSRMLTALGYTPATASSADLPAVTTPTGASLVTVLPGGPVQTLADVQTVANGEQYLYQISFDLATHRLLGEDNSVKGPDGKVLQTYRSVAGPVQVYDPASIDHGIFDPKNVEGCS